MFWDKFTQSLSFTGVKNVVVWQDVVFGVLLIPITLILLRWLVDYINAKQPLYQLLHGFTSTDIRVFVFLSQLSAIDNSGRLTLDQKYVVRYPRPLPGHRDNIEFEAKQRVDPVWSEGDGECLASVYNVFGKVGKTQGLNIGDSIGDWYKWSVPTISIGFCPKTKKLMDKCDPIYFSLDSITLSIKNGLQLGCISPDDAGVIQKTFIKDSKKPVLLLAGLGVLGTSVAGYCLNKYGSDFGKLYGNKPFCALISARIDEGKESATIKAIFPKPSLDKIIAHYPTFHKYKKII